MGIVDPLWTEAEERRRKFSHWHLSLAMPTNPTYNGLIATGVCHNYI